MIAFLVTAFYVAGVLSAIHAAMTARTAQGAVAWSVSLVSFPFIAVPAYLVLGRNKFDGMAEAFNERHDEIDEFLVEFNDRLDPWVIPAEDAPSWHEAIRRLSGFELTRNNRVELLINGEATFDSILAGVAEAQDYVLFQFYMFHDDGLGRRVQRALIERARAGVKVCMLYDEVGSKGLPKRYLDELRAAGLPALDEGAADDRAVRRRARAVLRQPHVHAQPILAAGRHLPHHLEGVGVALAHLEEPRPDLVRPRVRRHRAQGEEQRQGTPAHHGRGASSAGGSSNRA